MSVMQELLAMSRKMEQRLAQIQQNQVKIVDGLERSIERKQALLEELGQAAGR